jgi:hypothetical protein
MTFINRMCRATYGSAQEADLAVARLAAAA